MHDGGGLRHLDEDALDALGVGTAEVIASIEGLMLACAEGRAFCAPKSHIQLPDGRYVMSTMAIADDPPFMAVKSLALNPRNPQRGQPLINAVVTLLDSDSGRPVATLDGNWITAVRTAGLSVTAAKYMANADAKTIGFVGCGVQARSHLQAFSDLFPLTEVTFLPDGQGGLVTNLELRVAIRDEEGRRAEVPMVPMVVTVEEDPQPGLYGRFETRLKLRRQTHSAAVGVYDPASGRIFSATIEISP